MIDVNTIIGYDVGTDKIDLSNINNLIELRPVEIYHKLDGSINDKPSFAIVMTNYVGMTVVGQMSLEMFNKAMNKCGYNIVKL